VLPCSGVAGWLGFGATDCDWASFTLKLSTCLVHGFACGHGLLMLCVCVCLLPACSTRVLGGSGQLGVPRVEKPQVTEPKPFNLRSDSRARMRRSHEQPNMQQAAAAAHFKAQPLNRSILDGPVSDTLKVASCGESSGADAEGLDASGWLVRCSSGF
jgi:hypothetical protein